MHIWNIPDRHKIEPFPLILHSQRDLECGCSTISIQETMQSKEASITMCINNAHCKTSFPHSPHWQGIMVVNYLYMSRMPVNSYKPACLFSAVLLCSLDFILEKMRHTSWSQRKISRLILLVLMAVINGTQGGNKQKEIKRCLMERSMA